MKFNKKITVVSLSTVLGLGLVGSITGAVAWYQYSTRTTSSIIGTSTGKGGTLQIKANGGAWKRDLVTADAIAATNGFVAFQPVTFGETAKNAALPNTGAYKQPVRGNAAMTSWSAAAGGNTKTDDYLQYTINLQALTVNGSANERTKLPVYITDFVIQDHNSSDSLDISNAVRIHLAVTDSEGSRYFLISKNSLGETGLATWGKLDLDGDGEADKADRYEYQAATDYIEYGKNTGTGATNVQTSYIPSDIIATKDSTTGDIASGQESKIIAYTPSKTDTVETTIVVTIWNEGWAQLDPYASPKDTNVVAMWDPTLRNNAQFDIGFTFDVGNNAF